MTRISRHGPGALIGVIATPVIAWCFLYSVEKVRMAMASAVAEAPAGDPPGTNWAGLGVMLVGAVTVGLVAGSRVSPLASLIPGTLIGLLGLLWAIKPAWTSDQTAKTTLLPEDLYLGYLNLAATGTFLIVGIALLAASAVPSRWRGAAGPAPAPAEPREPGPDEDVLGP